MASGTRSSKRKSSPSHSLKKKRRNKDRSKKRIKLGKRKSKKVSRRDSPDSHTNDESLSDSSASYSSAGSDRRRSRSRLRNNTEKRRKKSKRSSSKRETNKDTTQIRKSKTLKRGRDTDAKKKRHGRMQRGKPSVSSSSRSLSCSTCESSDHSERESERTKKRVKRSGRQRDRRSSDDGMRDDEMIGKREKGSTRGLDEDRLLRSYSSSRLLSGGDGYLSEERVLNENGSRRLRSVIISKKECEESDMEHIARDEQKEEIVCDHDDYPSPRSNDSIDGETRREISYRSHAVAGQIGSLEESEDPYKETDCSNINVSKLSESGDLGTTEYCNLEVSTLSDVRAKDSCVKALSAKTASGGVSLESVLRQKALENLKKFKGGVRVNPNNPVKAEVSDDGEEKEPVLQNADLQVKKNDQKGNAEGLVASSVPHQAKLSAVAKSKAFSSTVNTCVSPPLSDKPKEEAVSLKKEQLAKDALRTTQPLEESSFIDSSAAESLQPLAQDSKVITPSGKGRLITLKKEKPSFTHGSTAEGLQPLARDSKMIPPPRKGRVINLKRADKIPAQEQPSTQESALQKTHTSEISFPVESLGSHPDDPKVLVDHIADKLETGASVQCLEPDMSAPAQTNIDVESLQTCPKKGADDVDKNSTGVSNMQGQSSDAKETEGQFEQKTMSVMRGGEMVQVSYKVYIPKRAQALARRKLKR